MKWEKMKLTECCISIADGDHQPPPKAPNGVAFVTISNINKSNQFDFSDIMYVPHEYYERLDDKRKARTGDILYSVVGSFGIPVLIKEGTPPFVFQRHIAILRPNDKLDSRFLYYTMLSRDFFAKADAAAIGSAQRTVSLSALRNIEIDVPPIEVQRRIADILSAYDDLIEHNQKQIKLLEEAAQRLYKEWFIDLRFPGHEDVKIVDGVPEGWKKGTLSEVAVINARSVKNMESQSIINYVDIGSVRHGQIETREYIYGEAPGRARRLAQDGDIIWGMVRPNLRAYALVQYPDENDIFSTGFAVISATKVPFTYLYNLTTQDNFVGYLVNCTNGAAYPAVKPVHFEQAVILIPAKTVLIRYHKLVEPMVRKIHGLSKQNRNLEEARNMLLPKLMSGEMEV